MNKEYYKSWSTMTDSEKIEYLRSENILLKNKISNLENKVYGFND